MQISNWSFFVNTIFPIGQTQAKRKGCDLMRLAITTKLLPAKKKPPEMVPAHNKILFYSYLEDKYYIIIGKPSFHSISS